MGATKRLYRIEEGKAIAGVCTGLAEYFDLDLKLVRILTVILAFCSGIPIIIYLVFAIALPTKEAEIKKAETIEDEYAYDKNDYKY